MGGGGRECIATFRTWVRLDWGRGELVVLVWLWGKQLLYSMKYIDKVGKKYNIHIKNKLIPAVVKRQKREISEELIVLPVTICFLSHSQSLKRFMHI